jgi:hypothetical protein
MKILRLGLRAGALPDVSRQDLMKVPAFKAADRFMQGASLELLNIENWLIANLTERHRGNSSRFGEGTRWRVNPKVFDGRFQKLAEISLAEADEVHRMLVGLRRK